MKKSFPALLALSLLLAASTATAELELYELRGPATAAATLARIHEALVLDTDDPPLAEVVFSLDLPAFAFSDPDSGGPFVFANDPDTAAALKAALDEKGWRRRDFDVPPEWPDTLRLYSRDDDVATNHPVLFIPLGKHIFLTDHLPPAGTRGSDFAEVLSRLPSVIPAEGVFAGQWLSDPGDGDFPVDGISSVNFGIALDGDTVALQIVLPPSSDTPLAAWLRSIPPIPDSTTCVNRPDAVATFALAPLPPLPDDLPVRPSRNMREFAAFLNRHPRIPVSAALLRPPRKNDDTPSLLAFAGFDDPAVPFASLFRAFGSFGTNTVHRNVAVLAPVPEDNAPLPDSPAWKIFRDLRDGSNEMPSFAALPTGVLAAANAPRKAVSKAIDAALDATLPPFESSPAFRDAFPYPDARAVAVLHVDLRALAAAYPDITHFIGLDLSEIENDDGRPLSLDAFLYVAPDASLALRVRVPLAVANAL